MPDLCTDEQRWQIVDLFGHFGIYDLAQIKADAARILKLEDGLTDLRNLTRGEADDLLAELRRARAQERVGGDS